MSTETDFSKVLLLGCGQVGIEMAKQIRQAKGEEKRKRLASLQPMEELPLRVILVPLEPDVAKVFKDSQSVNKALRAFIEAIPKVEYRKQRKTA